MPTWQLLLASCELDCLRIDDIPHDFVLGHDHVGQATIEPAAPKVPAALAIDDLSRDTIRTEAMAFIVTDTVATPARPS